MLEHALTKQQTYFNEMDKKIRHANIFESNQRKTIFTGKEMELIKMTSSIKQIKELNKEYL